MAVAGEVFDGHDYVFDSYKKGARLAIVSHLEFKNRDQIPSDFPLISVKDTTEALRQLAASYRSELKAQVFAVAGSNGKTTTKEWIAFLLQEIYGPQKVFKTLKSQNSILGIALSLLQIRDEDFAIIEIGIDEPGWMDQHLQVVAPTHGLITTIAEEHLNKLQTIEKVAQEELKLLEYLKVNKGSFAANLDSIWIKKATYPSSTLTYALDQEADVEGVFAPPQTLNAFGIRWHNPLPGKHNAQNLLAALTALRILRPQISREELLELSKRIHDFRGEAHRSLWLHYANDIRIFDDCYNANPDSMERSLQSYSELTHGCVQHLVLGDMLDLGEATEKSHVRILNLALVLGFDHLYLLGKNFAEARKKVTQLPKTCQSFETHEQVVNAIAQNLKPAHTVFLKGSRGMSLEKILEGLEQTSLLKLK